MTTSLVTGGAGFIGRHLVAVLLARGHRVRILDIEDAPDLRDQAEVIRGSILDQHQLARALRGVDRLYHLAGNPDLWAPRRTLFDEVNRAGTESVMRAARGADLETVLHCSTESVLIGRRRANGTPVDERVALDLDDMVGPYCRSKFLAERAAHEAAREGLPVVIVNPTMPLGPGDRHFTPPTRMLHFLLTRPPPAYLEFRFNVVDVRDAAEGMALAAERGTIGERYILGGENLSMREFLGIVASASGRRMPRMAIPKWVALAASHASEFTADLITNRMPNAPVTGVRLAAHSLDFDTRRARSELGFRTRPLAATVADAIAWLQLEGHLPLPPRHAPARRPGVASRPAAPARSSAVSRSGSILDTR